MKLKLTFLLLLVMSMAASTCMVSGLVIEDVMVFGDFAMDGTGPAGEQLVFGPQDDFVGLSFDLSDVSPTDYIVIEFWSPSGDLYVELNWTAPDWIDAGTDWDFWEDIEIHGDWRASDPNMLMTDYPGQWAANVYLKGEWWDHVVFEVISDGSGSTSTDSTTTTNDDDTKVRGYYMWPTDIAVVGDFAYGQNVTVEVLIEHNFPSEVPIFPTIIDGNGDLRGQTDDVIQGAGTKTISIEMMTTEHDEPMWFVVVGYYYIDGNWVYQEQGGTLPFSLSGMASGDGITDAAPDGFEIPEGFDLSDIDMDQITSSLNDTFQRGLDLLKDVEIPEELGEIEDTIKEQTGIPGFPVGAMVAGVSLLGLALRRRD